ncbi:MAG TPA: hypothetical protein VGW38_08940 [Chloroflexota bacterium]|nr:hypothetical protein [Chloroflexota bacterium]
MIEPCYFHDIIVTETASVSPTSIAGNLLQQARHQPKEGDMYERTYCKKCETYRFTNPGESCWHCKPPAEQRAILEAKQQAKEGAPAVSPALITFGGVEVDAPGFTIDSFERAICRALVDGLEIHEAAGYHLATHRGVNGGYHVTRERCDCKAGEHDQPCKHRAMLCFHLDIREPAIRKQWAGAGARRRPI